MSAPVPAPRAAQEPKKPVPLPRKSVQAKYEEMPENANTFSRRVRSIGNTSRQITGEISGKVQETRKAVIESTRQSVRRITRRFSNASDGQTDNGSDRKEDVEEKIEETSEIFNTLRFRSPLTVQEENENTYTNVTVESEPEELIYYPPPQYPPPPLPDESVYDQPQSLKSDSDGSTPLLNRTQYEAIFPLFPLSSDSESSSNGTPHPLNLSRSDSWSFYDPVTKDNAGSPGSSPDDSKSETSSASHLNSLYENHILLRPKVEETEPRKPTESTILQFDPLQNHNYENRDISMLEQLLQGDLYGNISNAGSCDQWSISNESEVEEYINPPTPPTRFDSLPEELPRPSVEDKSRTNWFTDAKPQKEEVSNKRSWLNNALKRVEAVKNEAVKNIWLKQKEKPLDRPMLNYRSMIQHQGMLFKITTTAVEELFGEFNVRWCVLAKGAIACYSDKTCEVVKETFPLENILSIQMLFDQKYKFENEDMYCFELNTSGRSRGGHIYGIGNPTDCRLWMQRIVEALTNRFPVNITNNCIRMGWAYIREGCSGKWIGAWILLSSRSLHYVQDNVPMQTIDLRKARCIALQEPEADSPRTTDKGPNMLVDTANSGVLYLRMWTMRETKVWCHKIKTAAHNNGISLDEQQLTKNDVPVIVEKCINFIYAHGIIAGSMSEGIYRRSGGTNVISDLMNQFRRDAWAVTLTSQKCNEHDVANVLKRFLRDLPEPLLASDKRQYLCQVSVIKNKEDKIRMYRAVLDHFTPVAANTVQKLISHLHFVQSQSAKNLMTVDNLSAIWGPTLMHEVNENARWSHSEATVVKDMITLYRDLFPPSSEELEREKLMLQVLERWQRARHGHGPATVRASGDLRVWIYLHNKQGETVNITIGPQRLAGDICSELAPKMKLPVYELQLEELVLNDSLVRPVHHSEKVLDVVLRWSYWDEPDRKDNCLILAPMSKYKEMIAENPQPIFSEELKYADNKTRAFKTLTFEFTKAQLCCYKDKNCTVKIQEWNIEDIMWYVGHEPKRNPQARWAVTFIEKRSKPQRTKAVPYFGHTIAGTDISRRAHWLGAMLRGLHPGGLALPLAQITTIVE